jgi:hypothetical protein
VNEIKRVYLNEAIGSLTNSFTFFSKAVNRRNRTPNAHVSEPLAEKYTRLILKNPSPSSKERRVWVPDIVHPKTQSTRSLYAKYLKPCQKNLPPPRTKATSTSAKEVLPEHSDIYFILGSKLLELPIRDRLCCCFIKRPALVFTSHSFDVVTSSSARV